jgi:hypothetical protein
VDVRISNSEYESRGWRIAEIAPDFRLEDAWALPVQGGVEEFPDLIAELSSFDPAEVSSPATRVLFAIRHLLGGLLGWDRPQRQLAIPDESASSLRARLPEDLRGSADSTRLHSREITFKPLYRTDREWAAEVSNQTVHGVLHLGWADAGGGVYRGEMGVYVKPRGLLGQAYMAAIAPFRHLIVYPALMREVERRWNARTPQVSARS